MAGVASAQAYGVVFVCNQELTHSQRASLRQVAGALPLELYHLERLAALLDQPAMAQVRRQFLYVDTADGDALAALHLAEAEYRREIFPRLVPAGFQFGGDGADFAFLIENEGDSLFRVGSAVCRWRLDHDGLYAWTAQNHVRLLCDPEAYVQAIDVETAIVRLGAPRRVSFRTTGLELRGHFTSHWGRCFQGQPLEPLPVERLARGDVQVDGQGLLSGRMETVKRHVVWA